MDDLTLKRILNEKGIDITTAETLEEKTLQFERALKEVIKPRNISDRTSFRNITNWLQRNCESGRFDMNSIFRRVIDFALEASGPESRKPAAVFTAILKKELGYLKNGGK